MIYLNSKYHNVQLLGFFCITVLSNTEELEEDNSSTIMQQMVRSQIEIGSDVLMGGCVNLLILLWSSQYLVRAPCVRITQYSIKRFNLQSKAENVVIARQHVT